MGILEKIGNIDLEALQHKAEESERKVNEILINSRNIQKIILEIAKKLDIEVE